MKLARTGREQPKLGRWTLAGSRDGGVRFDTASGRNLSVFRSRRCTLSRVGEMIIHILACVCGDFSVSC